MAKTKYTALNSKENYVELQGETKLVDNRGVSRLNTVSTVATYEPDETAHDGSTLPDCRAHTIGT